ncbi:hypothetical protein BGZ73_003961 [Actinomortierella ambigua]|nr:hypothetical protein BGZ73_003961 [Actinomortierella ambigua]
MAPPDFRVVIAGAGVGGLCLAYFLELAKIDYVVLERAKEFRPLGSAMSLSSQAMRVFDQLGLLEDLVKTGIPTEGFKYYNRNAQGVMCRFADQTTIHGSILVGADGAYSAVRQSLYKNMKLKNLHVSESDTAPLKFDQFGILGITEPIVGLPKEVEGSEGGWMITLLPEKETDCFVYVIRLSGGRLGWRIGGKVLSGNMKDQENFRQSDWDVESIEDIKHELNDCPAPLVGKVSVLFENTKLISRVMLEEKHFDTWYEGRTVLIGDACHKMLPAGGQGANQTIMDAICIANLLQELPKDSVEDITKAFQRYYEIRAPNARKTTINSARFGHLLSSAGFVANLKRRIFFNYVPASVRLKGTDAILASKPILNYMPPIPMKGIIPDKSLPMTVHVGDQKNQGAAEVQPTNDDNQKSAVTL